MGRNPRRTLVRAGILLVASLLTFKFLLLPIRIQGESMAPAYSTGGINFVNAVPYLFRAPRRGEVVGIRLAGRSVMYLKRIVGLPGERLEIRAGIVRIDGRPLDEPYVKNRADWNVEEILLGPDEFFVIGDNRGMDQRRHEFGRAERNRIVGTILY